MLRRNVVGSTVNSDSSVGWGLKPGGPLGAFREEQAISGHRVSPSPFLSFIIISYARSTRNVVCPSGTWIENRPHLMPSNRLAWNPKRVGLIVHWNTHTHTHTYSSSLVLKKGIELQHALHTWRETVLFRHVHGLTTRSKLANSICCDRWVY